MLRYSFLFSLSAWVFVNMLQDEGMIFAWYGRWLERVPEWLSHPLGKCDICMAGQFGLWGYFLVGDYHVLNHLFFIVLTIFFIKIIDRIAYGLRGL